MVVRMLKDEKLKWLANKYDEFNMPLYLSYPVESNWNIGMQTEIPTINKGPVDVYVHYPFCKKLCYFCCCDRVAVSSEDKKDYYLQLLEQEIKLRFDYSDRIRTNSLHLGGGTPTYMSMQQLERLYNMLERHFQLNCAESINIEAYPDNEWVNKEKLLNLKQMGFKSISFGIQDFDMRVQTAINRQEDVVQARKMIEMAIDLGFLVHVDLCYGLPYQGVEEFVKTLQVIRKLNVHEIVIYAYIHFPLIYPLQRKISRESLPNRFEKFQIIQEANRILEEDYQKFGIDTFVRKDTVICEKWKKQQIIRNFMGTSVDSGGDLLGIGMSAISKIGNTYIKNCSNLHKYEELLEMNIVPIEKSYTMSQDDIIRNDIILNHILSKKMISINKIEKMYGITFCNYFENEYSKLKELEELGLVTQSGEDIIIKKDGEFVIKNIAHVFNQYH